MPQSQADQQQSTPVGASTGGSKTPTPEGSPTSVAVAAAAPPGYVNVAGVVVHKDGLVANPGLRALEANPTAVGQWCPRNDDPTHAVLGCNRLHKNAHAAAVGTNAGLPPPASPATTNGRPLFPNQLPVATTASASAAGPPSSTGSGPSPTTDQPPPMASLSALPSGGASNTSQHPTLLTETQRRAAIGAAVNSGGVGGGFRRPMGGEKLRKNQIASQILRAASDTSGPLIIPVSAAVPAQLPPTTTGAAAASAPLALPHSPATTNTAVNSQRSMSFGNINSDNVGEGVAGSQITSRSSLSRSVNAGGTTTHLNQQADQSGSSNPNAISVSHQLRADLHPHYTAHGGGGHNGNDDVVDPRSFQARFPHVVHMCVAHTFNLEDMMTLFRDDLDYQCEMCYDVLHVWREGAGGEGGGSSAIKLDQDEDDVIHRESSALIREDDERNASHHEHHTTTTTTSKKNRRGPGHHHRSHHRRGPRVGEGNPRASAVSMRKPFNLFLFQYGSVVFWGSPEVYAEIVEPFISDSVGTGGGSGGQASNLRSGAQRGGTTTDNNTTNNRGKKAAHRIVVALERAMGQRYPKDVILDRFPVRCSYEIAAFGSSDHAGPMGNQQQQTTLQPIVMGQQQQQLSGTYGGGGGEEPHITAGEAAAREAEMFKRSLLRNHHFIIPAVSDSIPMLCIAHALAQAAKVDVLEGMISQLMEQCHPLPTQLKDDGFVRITEKHLLQLRGEVLFYRMQLRGGSDLQAEPEPIWHFPAMETFYLITREVFEVEKLIDVLDSKLDAGNEILSVLSDQFSQRHSSRLEWIVIWLVFVEVIIGVLELILDLKPWFK